jgi:hypothetical protein
VLALSLFVARIFANDSHNSLAANQLALLADPTHAGTHLHDPPNEQNVHFWVNVQHSGQTKNRQEWVGKSGIPLLPLALNWAAIKVWVVSKAESQVEAALAALTNPQSPSLGCG